MTSTDLKFISSPSKFAISSLVISLFKFFVRKSIIINSEFVKFIFSRFFDNVFFVELYSKSPKYLLIPETFLLNLDLIAC